MKRTEHTQQWLDALRSGKYKQIQHTLRNDSGYCCLGVAAHVLGMNDETVQAAYEAAQEKMALSRDEFWNLIRFNDELNLTFPQIADKIEGMLEPVE
jgi:hypothetical protein